METEKNTAKTNMERIYIPPAKHGEEETLTVGINGKLWRIPKGKESEVPDFVAAEIRRSWKAEADWEKTRKKKLYESQKPNM